MKLTSFLRVDIDIAFVFLFYLTYFMLRFVEINQILMPICKFFFAYSY